MIPQSVDHGQENSPSGRRIAGIVLGLVLFVVTIALPPPEDMPTVAWQVAGTAALMATWWITEALPIPVTALVPIVAFPLSGSATINEAAAPYASPLIFLFLGGFMLALALERWNLHRRIALTILTRFGARPSALVAGFLIAAASLSMWVSNTATAMMMLPIGLSVIGLLHADGVAALPPNEDRNFAVALLLAWGAPDQAAMQGSWNNPHSAPCHRSPGLQRREVFPQWGLLDRIHGPGRGRHTQC